MKTYIYRDGYSVLFRVPRRRDLAEDGHAFWLDLGCPNGVNAFLGKEIKDLTLYELQTTARAANGSLPYRVSIPEDDPSTVDVNRRLASGVDAIAKMFNTLASNIDEAKMQIARFYGLVGGSGYFRVVPAKRGLSKVMENEIAKCYDD